MPGFRIETASLGELQIPVDIFQTGSGTSTNMNASGVIANRAAEILGVARSNKVRPHARYKSSTKR